MKLGPVAKGRIWTFSWVKSRRKARSHGDDGPACAGGCESDSSLWKSQAFEVVF